MTKQEKHELRVKTAKQLKQVLATLTFLSEKELLELSENLSKTLKSSID